MFSLKDAVAHLSVSNPNEILTIEKYRIYKGEYQSQEVVLKVLEDIDEGDVKREASFLSKLIHPNIVQLKAPLRVSVLKKEVLCLNIWHLILKSME